MPATGSGWRGAAATTREFRAIPAGLLRTIVPAAPDAWITALARFGTMSFGQVAESAIRLARDRVRCGPVTAPHSLACCSGACGAGWSREAAGRRVRLCSDVKMSTCYT